MAASSASASDWPMELAHVSNIGWNFTSQDRSAIR